MKPAEHQIKDTIQQIKRRLSDPAMNKPANRAVKEGYTETVSILVEGRTTYDRIDNLTTVQGRAIAVLAVDYLNGDCEMRVLTGVPLRTQ